MYKVVPMGPTMFGLVHKLLMDNKYPTMAGLLKDRWDEEKPCDDENPPQGTKTPSTVFPGAEAVKFVTGGNSMAKGDVHDILYKSLRSYQDGVFRHGNGNLTGRLGPELTALYDHLKAALDQIGAGLPTLPDRDQPQKATSPAVSEWVRLSPNTTSAARELGYGVASTPTEPPAPPAKTYGIDFGVNTIKVLTKDQWIAYLERRILTGVIDFLPSIPDTLSIYATPRNWSLESLRREWQTLKGKK
jgi:hypothetical protein